MDDLQALVEELNRRLNTSLCAKRDGFILHNSGTLSGFLVTIDQDGWTVRLSHTVTRALFDKRSWSDSDAVKQLAGYVKGCQIDYGIRQQLW